MCCGNAVYTSNAWACSRVHDAGSGCNRLASVRHHCISEIVLSTPSSVLQQLALDTRLQGMAGLQETLEALHPALSAMPRLQVLLCRRPQRGRRLVVGHYLVSQEDRHADRRIRGGQLRRRTGRHMEEGPRERRHQVLQDSQVDGWTLTRRGSGRTPWHQAAAVSRPRPTGRSAQLRLPSGST